MVVHYPSSFQAYRYNVNGESVIIKHHRLFNYHRRQGVFTKKGVVSIIVAFGFISTSALSSLYDTFMPHQIPDSYLPANMEAAEERRVKFRHHVIRDHVIGEPVLPDA